MYIYMRTEDDLTLSVTLAIGRKGSKITELSIDTETI